MGQISDKHDYEVVLDVRDGRKYIDTPCMIRNFEKVVGTYPTWQQARKAHPEATDLTERHR